MAINASRTWTLNSSSVEGGVNTARDASTGTWAIDWSRRLNDDTVLASAVATSAGLTIGSPVVSGNKRFVELPITAGITADTDHVIAVEATYEDGTVDAVNVTLRGTA